MLLCSRGMAGASASRRAKLLPLTRHINSQQEADEVYRLGIARKAEPLDHLESRYQDFQRRMISTRSAPPAETSDSQPARPKRQALATTAKGPSATSSRTGGSRSAAEPLPAAASSSRPGFQIFVDPSGEGGELGEAENEWHDLGTRKTRVKENIPETKKLAGTTIKQAGKAKRVASASSGSSSGSKIVPFKDPVDPPGPARKSATSSKAPSAKGTTEPSAATTRKTTSKGFVPFVDDEEPVPAPAPAKPTSKAFLPFVDEDKPLAAPSVRKPSAKGFVPFVDESEASTEALNPARTPTPKFVPFRDEVSTPIAPLSGFSLNPLQDDAEPTRNTALGGEAVIKVKQASVKSTVPTSEAEALRKDPLKNYDS